MKKKGKNTGRSIGWLVRNEKTRVRPSKKKGFGFSPNVIHLYNASFDISLFPLYGVSNYKL